MEKVKGPTLFSLIPQEIKDEWDRWDYKLFDLHGDDYPEVRLHLLNKDGTKQVVTFGLHEGVKEI